MAKGTPARRGPSRAARAAEKGKASALARMKRMKEKSAEMQGKALGLGAAYMASDWWATREANEDRGEKKAAFEIGSWEIDGSKAGGIAALAGAFGVLGDDTYDDALYGAGLGVMSAHRGIARYKLRMAEPPGE